MLSQQSTLMWCVAAWLLLLYKHFCRCLEQQAAFVVIVAYLTVAHYSQSFLYTPTCPAFLTIFFLGWRITARAVLYTLSILTEAFLPLDWIAGHDNGASTST